MTTWPFVPTRPVILDEYNDLEARYGAFGPPVSVRERIPPLDLFPVVTPDADEPDGSAVGGTSEPLAAPTPPVSASNRSFPAAAPSAPQHESERRWESRSRRSPGSPFWRVDDEDVATRRGVHGSTLPMSTPARHVEVTRLARRGNLLVQQVLPQAPAEPC